MLTLDGHSLTLADIQQVARQTLSVTLAVEARQRMVQSRQWVEAIVERGEPVYGINTGFGIFADKRISPKDTQHLQRNLILSHAVGVGEPFADEVTRAAM